MTSGDIDEQLRLQFIERASAYLLSIGEIKNKQQFTAQITQLPDTMRGKIMTYAQEMKNEGIDIGIEKVAINMLKLKVSESIISQSTGLSPQQISALKQAHNL